MKKPFFSVLFLFSVSVAVTAQQLPTIIIVNNTGITITSVYVSPANSDSWGKDILGGVTLQKSSYIHELPSPLSRESVYDIMLKNGEGQEFIKWDIKVSDNAQVVFTADDLAKGEEPDPAAITKLLVQGASQSAAPVSPAVGVSALRLAIVNAAQRYLGARYVYGSQLPPEKFDCSGLVNQAYKEGANIAIPRSTSEIWAKGKKISKADLAPGDIIVFSENSTTPSHVAIYVDETYMIHSVSIGSPTGVVQTKQTDGSWPRKVMGYVTFVGVSTAASASAREPAVTEFPVLAASFLDRNPDIVPVQAGTGMSFVITNGTGADGNFDIFFYKIGSLRANSEKETLSIANAASKASKAFFFAEKGQYRLEIASRADNKTLLDYTFNVEE
jgi:cell wall-associated NlpC family hydrolase